METGVDLVDINEFKRSIKRSGTTFIEKIFTQRELENKRPEHLTGIFCVKECAVKIGLIKTGEWLRIEVRNDNKGKPYLCFTGGNKCKNIAVSISHTRDMCVAVLVKF